MCTKKTYCPMGPTPPFTGDVNPISVNSQAWIMHPINQWETSCSSLAVTTSSFHPQPCRDDTDIVAVSTEPRIRSDGDGWGLWGGWGAVFWDSNCSQSCRAAGTGRGARPQCAAEAPMCQEQLALSPLWVRSLKYNTIAPVSFSNLRQLRPSPEIRRRNKRRISSG